MLPRHLRVHTRAEFQLVTRRGRRATRGSLVVYRLAVAGEPNSRAGVIVGRAVGNAVARHRVSRHLRAILAGEVSGRTGELIVARALPGAAQCDHWTLSGHLGEALVAAGRRPSGWDTGLGHGTGVAQ